MPVQLTIDQANAFASTLELSDEEFALLDRFIEADIHAGWNDVERRALKHIGSGPVHSSNPGMHALAQRWQRMLAAGRIMGLDTDARRTGHSGDMHTEVSPEQQESLLAACGSSATAAQALSDSSRAYQSFRTVTSGAPEMLPMLWTGSIYRSGPELKVNISTDRSGAYACGLGNEAWCVEIQIMAVDDCVISLGPIYTSEENGRRLLEGALALPEEILEALGTCDGGVPAGAVRILIEDAL